ncbi:MAG TPA: hypothetical protein VFV63_20960 [Ilumatobacteraceae bacterium]|nr:hypothetical protein [Ilumatobacteraceae bacterium]
MSVVHVAVEVGHKKSFASALDWPGWSRSGKDEDAAIEVLLAYIDRYRVVTDRAGIEFRPGRVDVVERLAGSASTDFGAPGAIAEWERRALGKAEAERIAALVSASWDVFGDVVAGAPAELRKGPRGGGRDRDKIVEHVVEAEQSYARQLGLGKPNQRPDLRGDIVAAIRRRPTDTAWPVRYAARRIAWHVVDHAWEIEDRSEV